jgi:hypothetical protein
MNHLEWELLPRRGIESGALRISFGMTRQDVRHMMTGQFLPLVPNTRYPDEDDFHTADKFTFVRIRYEGTQVRDIEFLGGKLAYQGVPLHAGVAFPEIRARFGEMGLTFRDTEWLGDGQDCPELGVNIATHEDVGGDGDEIEWVILSSDFTC